MLSIQKIIQAKNFRKNVIIIFFLLSAFVWLIIQAYRHYYISTDDAYINANTVQMAPRVTGKVSAVYVTNNQYVKKGELLFSIDQVPFQIAVQSAQAQLVMNLAEFDKANVTAERTNILVKKHVSSAQAGDDVDATLKFAAANVAFTKAALQSANLNLAYTQVSAPTSGWVTNLTLRAGDIVNANQPLFVLISDDEFWVDANFKESELKDIKPGQCATVVADMYPGYPLDAYVQSISGGAGAAFSLLPPQNATGNWVKITQRVPVRIMILNPDPKQPLRIGTSATVKVALHCVHQTTP